MALSWSAIIIMEFTQQTEFWQQKQCAVRHSNCGPFNHPKDGERWTKDDDRRRQTATDGRKTARWTKDGKRHVPNGPDSRPNFCRLCQTGPFQGHHFLLIKTTATQCCISITFSALFASYFLTTSISFFVVFWVGLIERTVATGTFIHEASPYY